MSSRSIGRIVLAVLAGYVANGALVALSEGLFSRIIPTTQPLPLYWLILDLMSQCIYTVIGGYVCCSIAGARERWAMLGLMAVGVLVGSISLVTSWRDEPHWYGITLLGVFPLCVWVGWKLREARKPGMKTD